MNVCQISLRILCGVSVLFLAACSDRDPAGARDHADTMILGVDPNGFDHGITPREDFYQYVNGGWLAATEIPQDKSTYGSFAEISDTAEANLQRIIEDATGGEHPAGSDLQKMADLYESFMDVDRIEDLGLKRLWPELEEIDAIRSKNELVRYIGHAQSVGVAHPLLFYVNQDAKNTQRYAAYLQQTGLGMPNRDYYLDEKFEDDRKSYAAYIRQVLKLASLGRPGEAADEIMAIETALARAHWTPVRNRDREAVYNKYTIEEAADLAPGFNWERFLEGAGLQDVGELIIRQPSYMSELAKSIDEVSLGSWKSYFKFRLLDAYAPYLPRAFVEAHFDFHKRSLRGVRKNAPRWKRGVSLADQVVGEILGKAYVEKHFSPEAKTRMDEMVANLSVAFDQAIADVEWMGDETKEAARKKLAKFTAKIGYPDRWRDYSDLEIDERELVGNLRRYAVVEHTRAVNKLGGPVDREEWLLTPQTVNAYYNSTMNEIVFPAAILQPPFFNVRADDAVNYGAIGAIIGHEFSHGFDDQGRRSDGDGNLRDWWTEKDAAEFKRRAQGLVEQFGEYRPVADGRVNGELTLGENIGDLAGLSIAFKAYEISREGKPAPRINGFTGDQRFFLGWAQVWRRKYTIEELRRRLLIDPHAPSRYRVIGIVPHLPAFYRAFDVRYGDAMYIAPEKRVKIW